MATTNVSKRRNDMSRKTALLAITALLWSLAIPAGAGRPIEESFDYVYVGCNLSGTPGSGFVYISGEGSFGWVWGELWTESEPFEDEPDLWLEGEATVTESEVQVAIDDFGLSVTFGDVIFEDTYQDSYRDGNRLVAWTQTTVGLEASGSASLGGTQFEEVECWAARGSVTYRSTNPHAYRIDYSNTYVFCYVEADGSFLELYASESRGTTWLGMWIIRGTEEMWEEVLLGDTELRRLTGDIRVEVPLYDMFTGDAAGAAAVDMTVTEGEAIRSTYLNRSTRAKVTETSLEVMGSVDLPDGRSFDLDGSCGGSRFTASGVSIDAAGPKESGRAPANDTPQGAIALSPGGSINQQTKATSFAPEASCGFEFEFEGEFEVWELPLAKTLWYTVEGTGGPITVDTAGSHFDTIVVVYVANGDEFHQVTCVDDVFDNGFSLQAAATFDTDPGVMYYVQVGGWAGEYGLLKLAVSDGEMR
jgi:hypothetical protein